MDKQPRSRVRSAGVVGVLVALTAFAWASWSGAIPQSALAQLATATSTVTITTTTPTRTVVASSATPARTPDPCQGGVLYGSRPPAQGGYGTFAFCGGTLDELLEATRCLRAGDLEGIAIWHNLVTGEFVVWLPAAEVGAASAAFLAAFPGEIPAGTIFIARCSA